MSTVRREIVLPVERDRAWELLTEPAELREWLADEVELEPEEGAPLRAVWWDERRRARGRRRGGRGAAPAALPLGRRRDRRPLARRVDARRRPRRHPRRRRGAAARPARGRRDPAPLAAARRRHHRRWPARPRWSTPDGAPHVDAVFAALADPDPPRGHRPPGAGAGVSASALAGELPVTRQAVAKHLAALDRAGLVDARGARAASCATRSTRRRWARRWPGWPRSARSGTTGSPGWRAAPPRAERRPGTPGCVSPAQLIITVGAPSTITPPCAV